MQEQKQKGESAELAECCELIRSFPESDVLLLLHISLFAAATLFYIGSNVIDWPLQAQRGLADGHEMYVHGNQSFLPRMPFPALRTHWSSDVDMRRDPRILLRYSCAHTWSHRYMTSLTNEQVFAELYYSKKAIKDVMGVTVQCWRPPYGDVDDRVRCVLLSLLTTTRTCELCRTDARHSASRRYIAQALGLRTIIWSDNTFDYEVSTLGINAVNANYQTIINGGKNGTYNSNGTIVLTHELNNDTMSLVQQNFAAIKAAFKYVAPVHVALNSTEPYVETGYTYPVRLSPPFRFAGRDGLSDGKSSLLLCRTLPSGRPVRLRSRSRVRLPSRATSRSRSRSRPARPVPSRLRSRTRLPVPDKPPRPRRARMLTPAQNLLRVDRLVRSLRLSWELLAQAPWPSCSKPFSLFKARSPSYYIISPHSPPLFALAVSSISCSPSSLPTLPLMMPNPLTTLPACDPARDPTSLFPCDWGHIIPCLSSRPPLVSLSRNISVHRQCLAFSSLPHSANYCHSFYWGQNTHDEVHKTVTCTRYESRGAESETEWESVSLFNDEMAYGGGTGFSARMAQQQ